MFNKSKAATITALNTLVRDKYFPKSTHVTIDCDGERAFYSMMNSKTRLNIMGVDINILSKVDPYHNRLAIVNRVIRTIRSFDYNGKGRPHEDYDKNIYPEMMKQLLDYYNNHTHATLSHLIGFNVSPREVLSDRDLEAFIAKRLLPENLVQAENRLKVGDRVKVYHQLNYPWEKRRFVMKPGKYSITKYIGNMPEVSPARSLQDNALAEVSQEQYSLMVPEYFLAKN
jgi:hypothetical protein